MVKITKIKNEYVLRLSEKEFVAFNILMETMMQKANATEMEATNQTNN